MSTKNILLFISSILLFIASANNSVSSIGFFTFLRFIICIVAIYVAYEKFKENNKTLDSLWIWVFVFIGILFNPFIEIAFKRNTWKTIDLIFGIFFILYILFFETKKEIFNNFKNKLSKIIIKNKILIISCLILILIILLLKNIGNNSSQINNGLISTTTIQNSSSSNQLIINNNLIKNMDNTNEQKTYTEAILHTNMGDISFEFSKDKPMTTSNFQKLASSGFFNGVKFHRVIKGFMIQTGDPLSKDDTKKSYWGTGGPGYKFQDELTGAEKYTIGTVAMANSGPNTNGSQFFIMTSNTDLPPLYTVFGKVVAGIDVAMKIQDVATDASDKPLTPITINSVELK